jgi:hypothetical protein
MKVVNVSKRFGPLIVRSVLIIIMMMMMVMMMMMLISIIKSNFKQFLVNISIVSLINS